MEKFASSFVSSLVRSGAYLVIYDPAGTYTLSTFLDWELGRWYGSFSSTGNVLKAQCGGPLKDLPAFIENLNL